MILGVRVIKFTPFALIYAACLLITKWNFIYDSSPIKTFFNRLASLLDKKSPYKIFSLLTIASIIFGIVKVLYYSSMPIVNARFPDNAVDHIKLNNLPRPIVTDFDFGGFLLYRYVNPDGTPGITVPVDGRTNVNREDMYISSSHWILGQKFDYPEKTSAQTLIVSTNHPIAAKMKELPELSSVWCLQFPTDNKLSDSKTILEYLYGKDKEIFEVYTRCK